MDKTVFGCPTIQAAILHVHCMKNTKFNLISYIAKCTLELASKETPMFSRAFCKGKHLGIEIAWVYSWLCKYTEHCSLAPSLTGTLPHVARNTFCIT